LYRMNSSSVYAFMAWCSVKHKDNFTFYLHLSCYNVLYLNLLHYVPIRNRNIQKRVKKLTGYLHVLIHLYQKITWAVTSKGHTRTKSAVRFPFPVIGLECN